MKEALCEESEERDGARGARSSFPGCPAFCSSGFRLEGAMTVPVYLPYYVLAGSAAMPAAILAGVRQALARADWPTPRPRPDDPRIHTRAHRLARRGDSPRAPRRVPGHLGSPADDSVCLTSSSAHFRWCWFRPTSFRHPCCSIWRRWPSSAGLLGNTCWAFSRSNFHTMSVSPSRRCESASCNPGGCKRAPLLVSVNIRVHPISLRAWSCNSRSWSSVETRAYPMRMRPIPSA